MDPFLKTFLDTGKTSNWQTEPASNEALRQALNFSKGNTGTLAAALNYLVKQKARDDAVNTFLEALVQMPDGLQALVESIANSKELIAHFSYESVSRVLVPYCNSDPRVLRFASFALTAKFEIPYEAALVLCDLGLAKGEDFLQPARLSESFIGEILSWIKLPPEDFFGRVAESVARECVEYVPKDEGRSWLSRFFREITDYYGAPAIVWTAGQIVRRKSDRVFWETAIEYLSRQRATALNGLTLTPEQHSWARDLGLQRIRDELRYAYDRVLSSSGLEQVVVHGPVVLDSVISDFPGHAFRPYWSWLQSEPAEAAIYSWFHEACADLAEDYVSPEDSITGALCAYLKSHAPKYRDVLEIAWRVQYPKQKLQLNIEYVDCRRGRDVGGADLVLVLSVQAKGVYARSSFVAFQCKKLKGESLSFSDRELVQMEMLRSFTHASYYMLYPCECLVHKASAPFVLSARTVDGLVKARKSPRVDRQTLVSVGRGLDEYFVADLLPGWSGDERWEAPDTILEVVEHALRPVFILQLNVVAVPTDQG